jgi:hypothetical protein
MFFTKVNINYCILFGRYDNDNRRLKSYEKFSSSKTL